MKRVLRIALVLAAMLPTLSTPSSAVDLPVISINEGALPFDLSPANFDNAPANFNNALANFDNSGANFNNTPANFDNSPANFSNSRGCNRRLILDGRVVGYYVIAQHGVTNFFTFAGRRVFYVPKQGRGVYDAADGRFVGILGRCDGTLSLGLTAAGLRRLLMSQ